MFASFEEFPKKKKALVIPMGPFVTTYLAVGNFLSVEKDYDSKLGVFCLISQFFESSLIKNWFRSETHVVFSLCSIFSTKHSAAG